MSEVSWFERIALCISNKNLPIGIVGLGYVGLPLAVAFANKGYRVIGVDVNQKRIDDVNSGISPITDVKNGTLHRLVKKGLLTATTKPEVLSGAFAVIMCVPTPVTKSKQPDLSYVKTTSETVGRCMSEGTLVILESTTYPGTTREVVAPIIENASGKKNYYLAYSPERVDPSSRNHTFSNTPKLVAGLNGQATDLASELYSKIVCKAVRVSSPEIGETAKVFENVFRSVNIGLVNELAMMCERLGISVWEVLNACETKPFGFMRFNPSPGVGGHCIPVDPYYLDQKVVEAGYHSRFIRVAMDINESMPEYVVNGIAKALDQRQGKALSRSQILLLGLAFKPNVGDVRESPAVEVMVELHKRGAGLKYHDPFVPEAKLPWGTIPSINRSDMAASLAESDCVVMLTNHSYYANIWRMIIENSKLLYDARGWTYTLSAYKLTNPHGLPNVVRLGE